jgi:glycine/D-amino acid oxidase-like deaminating enzyme
VITGCEAQAIETHRNAVSGLVTSKGRIGAKLVVNAAGGWAGGLGATAGAPLPLRPTRRHIAVTGPAPGIDPEWPYVWDVDASAYFRPESGGLLFSGCDIEDAPDCDETVRPEKVGAAVAKALVMVPSMGGLGVARSWAGIRTLTPDDRFTIGYDKRLKGLFWMAGLGGHGITAAPAAAQVAADVLLEGRSGVLDVKWLEPGRLLKG